MNYEVDIVMPWVDDKDPAWRQSKAKYSNDISALEDNSDMRFRDWENLRYWFRGIEKFAPWVNKVYFITCGHLPEWLNVEAPKLVHVKHEDYIPKEYLPTFSSHPIELNIHRIKGLSEHFVYFNDDTFLTKPTTIDTFFIDGLPCHSPIMHPIFPRGEGGIMPHVYMNTVMAVNRHFKMKEVLQRDHTKWFSIKNGIKTVVENAYNQNFPEFPGFKNEHMPVPVLKSTMEEVWAAEEEILSTTSSHRFRDMQDVNMYLFRYWELASGRFIPVNMGKLGKRLDIGDNIEEICDRIINQSQTMLCVNDMGLIREQDQFLTCRDRINKAFEELFPEKSSFEK